MNLALVLGQNSENLKPKLVSVKDNLNIECFADLRHFINGAIKRDLVFDRVIILSTLVKGNTYINDLYKYWNDYSRQSEIVLLCRKTVDDDLAKAFLSRFCSTAVTSMSVTSTTLHTLSEAVILPVSKLSEMYGISDYLAVEVEDDSYEEPKPELVPEPQPKQDAQNKPREKRTLFGALFGRKKNNPNQENISNLDMQEQIDNTNNYPEDMQDFVEESHLNNQQQVQNEELDNSVDYNDIPVEDEVPYTEDSASISEDSYENYNDNVNLLSPDNFDESEDEFSSQVDEIANASSDDFAEEETDDFDFSNQGGTSGFVEELVDEDFGDLTYTDNTIQENVDSTQSDVIPEEVEDVDTDLSVGSAEEEYRKKTEQPKVIKETVVKEVIKSVKTSSVLENIYKGTVHKLILVTGDRGSGVTTTAWSLALHFAQKVPVLYFDCDVVNHGLMNYIDYFGFKNYEPSHLQGVKLCRSSQAFNSCVCRWDSNIDLLTSDFGIEVSDDELILSQGIVAENLNKYGVVVVDCPLSKLHCVQDLILTGNLVLCVEDSKRGYMNVLNSLDRSELPLRYKRSMISRGTLVRTKVNRKNDYKRVMKYINNIVDLEDCNWLEMVTTEFTGKVTTELLTEILEG